MRMKSFFMAVVIFIMASAECRGVNVSVNSAAIDNVGLNETFFRLGDNLMLENSGMCLKGVISVSVQGMSGKRLFCMVEPVVDGSLMEDRKGGCNGIYAFRPATANYTGKVAFAMPYSWMGIGFNDRVDKERDLKIRVSILDLKSENPLLAEKVITIDGNNTRVDPDRVASDGLGSLLGGLFGGGDGTITCSSCDGVGLCPFCDGDGFIDPSICRKCSQHPGICRRCHGKGEEEIEIRESGGLFF